MQKDKGLATMTRTARTTRSGADRRLNETPRNGCHHSAKSAQRISSQIKDHPQTNPGALPSSARDNAPAGSTP